ncbi:MAG: ABC transporter ATP-binding protein [Faecalibacterium sp.]
MSLLEVRNLKKYFSTPNGGKLHAVDNVSFTIDQGKTLGVVGESGCGKSTLGRCIMKLVDTTDGEIFFNGKEIASMSPQEFAKHRYEIQMIFQDPYATLDGRMDIEQLIREPLVVSKMYPDKAAMDKRVDELMEMVGLAERVRHSFPHELDGGRRQRVGIARALALNPRFIVCDEPVSALDVSIQAQVLNLLEDLQKDHNLTYMFITHDMSVVKHISDDIAVMYLGQMVEKCSSDDLFAQTIHPYSVALLSAIPVPSIHVKKERILLKGEITSPINPKQCCRFAPRCPYATEECFSKEPVLREMLPNHFVACHKAEQFIK